MNSFVFLKCQKIVQKAHSFVELQGDAYSPKPWNIHCTVIIKQRKAANPHIYEAETRLSLT